MTEAKLKRIINLPDNVFPPTEQMIEVYLKFVNDTGGPKVTVTNGISDIINNYNMAKEYYEHLFDRTG